MARNAPRNRQAGSKEMVSVREREDKALRMASELNASAAQIAAALGFANASGAWKAVQRAAARIPAASAEDLRQVRALALADMQRKTLEILARKHPVLYKGKPVLGDDGQPLDDDEVKLKALDAWRRQEESFRRLLGLDAPKQVELSGRDGEPIPIEVRQQHLAERLRQVIEATVVEPAALEPAQGAEVDDGVA